jgi:hypothetical protein
VAIEIDGQRVGETGDGPTKLARVRPGLHGLRLVPPPDQELLPLARTIEVKKDAPELVRLALERAPFEPAWIPSALTWTGIGALTAGAAMVLVAALPSGPQPIELCSAGRCRPESGGFRTFCDLAHPDAACGGVMVAPLGLSLIGTGAAWAGGGFVLDDNAPSLWLRTGIGLVLGAAIYGLAAALNR